LIGNVHTMPVCHGLTGNHGESHQLNRQQGQVTIDGRALSVLESITSHHPADQSKDARAHRL
jgi:hypothetical protein